MPASGWRGLTLHLFLLRNQWMRVGAAKFETKRRRKGALSVLTSVDRRQQLNSLLWCQRRKEISYESGIYRCGKRNRHNRPPFDKRGHPSEQELDSFLEAGFSREQVLEVIGIVAASTITNYAGTIADPPLDDPFRQYAWRG